MAVIAIFNNQNNQKAWRSVIPCFYLFALIPSPVV